MRSFYNYFISFLSKYKKNSFLGILLAIIVSMVAAFFKDRQETTDKIISNEKKILVSDESISVLQGKVNILEGDSKLHVNSSSFGHYIDHADRERDAQALVNRSTEKDIGELMRGQQDIDRFIYNDTELKSDDRDNKN